MYLDITYIYIYLYLYSFEVPLRMSQQETVLATGRGMQVEQPSLEYLGNDVVMGTSQAKARQASNQPTTQPSSGW